MNMQNEMGQLQIDIHQHVDTELLIQAYACIIARDKLCQMKPQILESIYHVHVVLVLTTLASFQWPCTLSMAFRILILRVKNFHDNFNISIFLLRIPILVCTYTASVVLRPGKHRARARQVDTYEDCINLR